MRVLAMPTEAFQRIRTLRQDDSGHDGLEERPHYCLGRNAVLRNNQSSHSCVKIQDYSAEKLDCAEMFIAFWRTRYALQHSFKFVRLGDFKDGSMRHVQNLGQVIAGRVGRQ